MGATEGLDSVKLQAPQISALFRLLSHPSRLRIALALMGGEMTVSSIAEKSGVAQPALSRDLGRFRALGLVATRRVSREIYYRLSDKRLPDLLIALGAAL
jgi:ArsR family transcriptional regulator